MTNDPILAGWRRLACAVVLRAIRDLRRGNSCSAEAQRWLESRGAKGLVRALAETIMAIRAVDGVAGNDTRLAWPNWAGLRWHRHSGTYIAVQRQAWKARDPGCGAELSEQDELLLANRADSTLS